MSTSKKMLHKGECHCRAVRFEFDAPSEVDVTDCNCSICGMTAYEHVFVPEEHLRFLTGEDQLEQYRFNTGQAVHMFCKTCGIKPLYRPRSHPESWSVNLRCVEGGTLSVGKRIPFDGQDWDRKIAGLKEQT